MDAGSPVAPAPTITTSAILSQCRATLAALASSAPVPARAVAPMPANAALTKSLLGRFFFVSSFFPMILYSCASQYRLAPRNERVAADLGDRGRAGLGHDNLQFPPKNLDHGFDAFLSEGRKPPDVRAPYSNRRGSKRQRFENIRAASKSAVDEDRYLTCGSLHDLRQAFDCAPGAGVLMAAVIGNDNGINPVLGRKRRILARHDPLENQLHASRVPDAFHIIPAKLQAVLTIKRADRANPLDRIARLDPGDLGKVVMASGTALIGPAVQVPDAGALHRFRANRVGAAIIDGPHERGASRRLDALDEGRVQCVSQPRKPDWFAASRDHVPHYLWIDQDCGRPRQDLQRPRRGIEVENVECFFHGLDDGIILRAESRCSLRGERLRHHIFHPAGREPRVCQDWTGRQETQECTTFLPPAC